MVLDGPFDWAEAACAVTEIGTGGDVRQLRSSSRIKENGADSRAVPIQETSGHGAGAAGRGGVPRNGEVTVVNVIVRGVTAEEGTPRRVIDVSYFIELRRRWTGGTQ